jgi:hypothetical protein
MDEEEEEDAEYNYQPTESDDLCEGKATSNSEDENFR